MAIHVDHWNKILDKAEEDGVLLQGSGPRLERVWQELTPLLNRLRNKAVNRTAEGWKQMFKFWKYNTKKKATTTDYNQLEPHEFRYVLLCQRVGIPVGIRKETPTKEVPVTSEGKPQIEIPPGRANRKRKCDPEPDASPTSSSNVASNQYDIFLTYAKSHPGILTEDTEAISEEWKCLVSLLNCMRGQKRKTGNRDYVEWKKYFENWIFDVLNTEESELNSQELEIREIWDSVWTEKLNTEWDRSLKYLDLKKTADELKKFNDALENIPPDSRKRLKVELVITRER